MPRTSDIYFNWRGRASRKTYWLYSLPLAIAYFLSERFIEPINDWLYLIALFAIIVPIMMLNIKRCHDREWSGWFAVVLLIPIIGLWPMIELGFLRGTEGANKYGDPVIW